MPDSLAQRAEVFAYRHYREKLVRCIQRELASRLRRERRQKAILAWQDFHTERPMTSLDMYRALRGTVRHVLPRVRSVKPIYLGRRATPRIKCGTKGVCNWCGYECFWPNRWHFYCRLWYWILGDGPSGAHGFYAKMKRSACWNYMCPRTPCVECGSTTELQVDHKIPIGYAARLSPRDYIRSFFPSNLQYLCAQCHRRKTIQDNIKLRELRIEQDGVTPTQKNYDGMSLACMYLDNTINV